MNIIVCLDDNDGMLFFGRRQSMDRVLRAQARLLAGGEPLRMNGYSARQFAEDGAQVTVAEDFLATAPEDSWCFVENTPILPHLERIGMVAVYRWNRSYPCDQKFPTSEFAHRWTLLHSRTFAGSSHDTITEEIYRL